MVYLSSIHRFIYLHLISQCWAFCFSNFGVKSLNLDNKRLDPKVCANLTTTGKTEWSKEMLIVQLVISAVTLLALVWIYSRLAEKQKNNSSTQELLQRLLNEQRQEQQTQRERFDEHQIKTLKIIQDSLKTEIQDMRAQITTSLTQQTTTVDNRLKEIGGRVDEKLSEGFKKTNETFLGVMQRLSIIDAAQKKITELSTNVVSLQEILSDKRSRGAFGEVQLNALLRNMLPERHFSLQHQFSNEMRVDCLLFLPEPTGNIAIDAKFPLESYHKYKDNDADPVQKQTAMRQFRKDIKKHIKDIAGKYILPGETADGAMLFIPAEAIFAEIHSYFPELIEEAHKSHVWLVSPTTMMAVLTTVRAVLKDADTREQIHIIQEHLNALGEDFSRFQERMDKLAKHIHQAQQDVEQVHKSSRKISNRFSKIEQVDLQLTESKEVTPLLE